MQTAPPGQELVSRVRRDVGGVLDAGLVEGFMVGIDVAGILAAAATAEHDLDLLLEPGRVLDIRRGDDPAAEETNMGKFVEILQRDELGFHSAHGEAGHSSIGLIGKRAKVGVNIRDEFTDQYHLECRGGPSKWV